MAKAPIAAELDQRFHRPSYRAICRGGIPYIAAGFAGGGSSHPSATPQHGIVSRRECRFTAGTKKWAGPCTHAPRIIQTVRRGKAHFPPRLFGISSLPRQPENADHGGAASAGALIFRGMGILPMGTHGQDARATPHRTLSALCLTPKPSGSPVNGCCGKGVIRRKSFLR